MVGTNLNIYRSFQNCRLVILMQESSENKIIYNIKKNQENDFIVEVGYGYKD